MTARLAGLAVAALALSASPAWAQAGGGAHEPPAHWPEPVEDSRTYSLFLFEQAEYRSADAGDTLRWDVLAWVGGDYDRFWLETEGGAATTGGGAELERFDLLYGRLISPFWDFQVGLSHQRSWSSGDSRGRTSAVIGLQGRAPYNFEVDTNLRVSQDGDVSFDLQGSLDLLLTQRLVLQPRLETAVAVQAVEELGIGEGVNGLRLGARLRYEIRRELAPYLGFSWRRAFGDTAELAGEAGDGTSDFELVAGVRLWF